MSDMRDTERPDQMGESESGYGEGMQSPQPGAPGEHSGQSMEAESGSDRGFDSGSGMTGDDSSRQSEGADDQEYGSREQEFRSGDGEER